MMIGELQTSKMGLNNEQALVNVIIYFAFISLMCVIILNLFVGIAVGEIKTVLYEAYIQQISMRIIFVLKTQQTMHILRRMMKYSTYDYNRDELKVTRLKDRIFAFLKKKLLTQKQIVILVDPQKRLENNIQELSHNTSRELSTMKQAFCTQVLEVEQKLSNSQRRLEDIITEQSRKIATCFEASKELTTFQIRNLELKLIHAQNRGDDTVETQTRKNAEQLETASRSISAAIKSVETKCDQTRLEEEIRQLKQKTTARFENFEASLASILHQIGRIELQLVNIATNLQVHAQYNAVQPSLL